MESSTQASKAQTDVKRLFFETFPGFAIRCTATGRLTHYNPVALDIFGAQLPEQDIAAIFVENSPADFLSRIQCGGSVQLRKYIGSVLYDIHAWWDSGTEQAHFLGTPATPVITLPNDAPDVGQSINYAEMVEAIHEGIGQVDSDERINFCNRAFARMFGRQSPNELIGKCLFDIIPLDQHDAIRSQSGLRSEGTSSRYEFEVDDPVQGRRTLMVTVSPRMDADGRNIGSYGIVLDVTDRRRTLEQLESSEDRLQIIFDVVQTGIVLVDQDTHTILDVNPAAVQMIEAPREQIIGRKCHKFICPAEIGHCPVTDLGEEVNRSECTLLTADGREVPILKTVSKVTLDGKEVCLDSFVDISDRVEAERKLRESEHFLNAVVNHLPSMVFVKDADNLRFVRFNKAAERLTGFRQDETLGKSDFDFFPEEQAKSFQQADREVLERKDLLDIPEEPITCRDGEERILHTRKIPLFHEDGTPWCLLGLAEDITERKQAEEALKDSEQRLSSHLQNTPIAAIEWNCEFEVVEWNAAAERIFGFARHEALGKHAAGLLVPKSARERVNRVWSKLLENAGGSHSTNENFTKDGRTIVCEWINTPLVDKSGRVIGVASLAQNVTVRRSAEEALVRSNERFQQIAHNIKEAFLVINPDCSEVFYVSPAYEKIWGQSCESLYDNPRLWLESVHPEDRESVQAYFQNAISGTLTKIRFPEFRIVREDGTSRWIDMYGHSVLNETGEIEKIVGVISDITDERLVTLELAESEKFLRSTLDALSAHIAILEETGKIVTVNKAWREFAIDNNGFTADTCEGANYLDVCDRADGPDSYGGSEFAEGIRSVIAGTSDIHMLEYPCHSHEEERYFLGRITRFRGSDGRRVVVAHENITERVVAEKTLQKSEERYRELFDANPDGVLVADLETKNFIYANAAICKMLGYSVAELRTLGVEDIHPPEELPRVRKDFELQARGESPGGTARCLRKDGTMFTAVIRATRMTLGGRASLIGFFKDTTELRKAEEERRRLEGELLHARKLESVGSLASGIAHEINTPIQFVSDNTQFMKDSFESLIQLIDEHERLWQQVVSGTQPSELAEQWTQVTEAADLDYNKEEVPMAISQTLDGVERVTEIVRAMKDFAHQGQKEKSPSDINDMLKSTLTVARNELKYVAEVETEFDEHLPKTECYRNELNQVFLNLLVNAAHAIADVVDDGSKEKGTITVKTYRENGSIVVAIGDTGTGIPEEYRGRIFDPFFTTKDVGEGTGQGLSIAYQVVTDKHAGKLTFESETGKGTTFYIQIPIRREEDAKSHGNDSAG